MTPKKKSPLEGLRTHFENMSEDDRKRLAMDIKKAKEEREALKKAEDKARNTGECVVCQGEVVRRVSAATSKIGGVPLNGGTSIHCSQCGLKYAFIPRKKVETPT